MIDVEFCPECHVLATHPRPHLISCSRISVEHKAALADYYYEKCNEYSREKSKRDVRLAKMVLEWQGRCAILRHENNQLRRKISKQARTKP